MAKVVVEMSSDEAKLHRGMARLIAQQQRMEQGWERNAKASRQAGDQAAEGFGSRAVGQLASYAAGLVSITAAVNLATSALREMAAARERATREGRESERGMASLAQLANTPGEMKRLTEAAQQTFREGGAGSLGEAAGLVFSLESAGALSERGLFSQLRSQELVAEPAVFARAAATLIASMGEQETGGFRPLVSKAFGASKFSPASAEALLEAAARGGTSARALGISDEEVLAATARLATATGTAEMGGTQVASLLRSLDRAGGFQGLGLRGSLEQIQGMGLEGEELQKFFGRAEAVNAFRTLTADMEQLDKIIGEVTRSEEEDLVTRKLTLAGEIPTIAAARAARLGEAAESLSAERLGAFGNLATAAEASMVAQMREEGAGEFGIAIGRMGRRVSRFLGGDEQFIRDALREPGFVRGMAIGTAQLEPADRRRLQDQLDAFDSGAAVEDMRREEQRGFVEATNNLNRASDRVGGGTTLDKPDHDPGAPVSVSGFGMAF